MWKVTCRSQRVFTVMVFANILTCLQIVLTRGSGRGSKLFMYLEAGYEFIKDPSSSPPCRTYRKRSKRSYILRVYRLEAISTHSHDAKAVVVDSAEELAGLSLAQIAAAAELAKKRGLDGKYVIALLNTTIQPFETELQEAEGSTQALQLQLMLRPGL